MRRNPAERIPNAVQLAARVQRVLERLDAGGRVLDLRVPQRCLYCGEGRYRPAHDHIHTVGYSGPSKFPDVAQRQQHLPSADQPNRSSIYDALRKVRDQLLGSIYGSSNDIPLFLVCDYCANVQRFQLDLTPKGYGETWKP